MQGAAVGAIQAVNQTVNGADTGGSGTLTQVGSVDNVTGFGAVAFTFNQFDDGFGTVVDGSESITIDASGVNITFTSLSIKDTTGTFTMGGDIKYTETLDGAGNVIADSLTLNYAAEDAQGNQVKLQNFVVDSTYDTLFNLASESVSGRFYDSANGYLDISTTTPLVYSPAGATNPSSGGPCKN